MDFTTIDLIAATTNALNGGLLARRPDHYRQYTIVGIVLLAIAAGIAGGVSRDVILDDVPAAIENGWYIVCAAVAGVVAAYLPYFGSYRFREGFFQFMTAFSLPWYAAVGADKTLEAGLGWVPAILIGIIGATAGRFVVDISSGVTPKLFVRGEWFVGAAIVSSGVYVGCWYAGLSLVPATLVAFAAGFGFRLTALFLAWEEPEPWEPPKARAVEEYRPPLLDRLRAETRGKDPLRDDREKPG